MVVMYVACNPRRSQDLMVEREITELQSQFLRAPGEAPILLTYASVPIEELPLEIGKHRPDILHISAHGNKNELELSNADGKPVRLTSSMLRRYLNTEKPPRLVYLNACDSETIATELVGLVPMAIGTTAPITNRAARAAGLLFYDRLFSGMTVQNAFEAAQATLEALNRDSASSVLRCAHWIDPNQERLYHAPRIVACFSRDTPYSDRTYGIRLAVIGCPVNTTQVIFFTDDESFIRSIEEVEESYDEGEAYSAERELGFDLCQAVRTTPVRNVIWSQESERVVGDYKLFAVGVSAGGQLFTASSTLCEALELYFKLAGRETKRARRAIDDLRSNDGAEGLVTVKRTPHPALPIARKVPAPKGKSRS